MAYYQNIINDLDYNSAYSAYSGTVNGCYIDITADGDGWDCEVVVDGDVTSGWGHTPAIALRNATEI